MHAIQVAAVDLFDRNGFEGVTIEQVADEADVSPSTVYRHFGTKEGLIVHDEYDLAAFSSAAAALADHDLIDALRLGIAEISTQQFEDDLDLTLRRVRYLFEVESVRAATLVMAAQWADALAEAMGEVAADGSAGADAVTRHTQARAVIFGIFAALEQWWAAGATEPVLDVVERALVALRFPTDG